MYAVMVGYEAGQRHEAGVSDRQNTDQMAFHDYQQFLDFLAAGAYRTSVDGHFLYANSAMATLLGFRTVNDIKQTNARFLFRDEADRERWKADIAASSSATLVREANWRKVNGKPIRVLEVARAIREDGKVVAYEGVAVDVTDRLAPVEAASGLLADQSSTYHRSQDSIDCVLDLLPICVTRKDRNRQVVWANQMFCKLEQVSLDELLSRKNTDAKLYGAEYDDQYRRGDNEVFRTGRPHRCKEPHRYGDDTVRDVEVIKVPLFAEDGVSVIGVEVYFWDDITLSRPLREYYRATRIHELFRSTETAIYEHDLDGNYHYVSPSATELLGLKDVGPGELNMKDVIAPEYLEISRAHVMEKLRSPNQEDAATTYVVELLNAKGNRIPVEVNSRLLFKNGKPSGVIGYIRDLSAERRRLSEVHHRVKNNLQTIYALLDREQRGTENAEVALILRDCQSRILAIAELHEQLYRTNRVDHIAVHDYIPGLVKKLVQTYSQPWQKIDARVSVEPEIYLSLDAMIPCTLVLQELISNAMKHAFPKADRTTRGSIMVTLNPTGRDQEYRLQVADTGIGLPPGARLENSTSLGMTLIEGLVTKQLEGTIRTPNTSKGTYFDIVFCDPSPVSSRMPR